MPFVFVFKKLKSMKRIISALIILVSFMAQVSLAQNRQENSAIDLMLVRGDYQRVIDTCRLIITNDSSNAAAWYRMGLAYQNLLSDEKSFECFTHASSIDPENTRYNFLLAKGFLNKGKTARAKTLLENLCAGDTMNWSYAYYLTGIYMQEGKYDESIKSIRDSIHRTQQISCSSTSRDLPV
jgi:cytochrome c-type biogenesis protein CcmH/NrfG